MSLIELVLACGVLSLVTFFSVGGLNFFTKVSKGIESSANTETEILGWMSVMRKYFSISLYDKRSPPSLATIKRTETIIAGKRAVRYDYKLDNQSEIPTTVFSLTNSCMDIPSGLQGRMPQFNSSYLSSMMSDVGGYLGCKSDLTALNCNANETIYSQFTASMAMVNAGVKVMLDMFPNGLKSMGTWKQTVGRPLAGFICIQRDTVDYIHLEIYFAKLNHMRSSDSDLNHRLKWEVRKMLVPPSSNGNSQYIP